MLSQRANRFKAKKTRFIANAKWKSLACAEPHRKWGMKAAAFIKQHSGVLRCVVVPPALLTFWPVSYIQSGSY
jgi:hypothetical protein